MVVSYFFKIPEQIGDLGGCSCKVRSCFSSVTSCPSVLSSFPGPSSACSALAQGRGWPGLLWLHGQPPSIAWLARVLSAWTFLCSLPLLSPATIFLLLFFCLLTNLLILSSPLLPPSSIQRGKRREQTLKRKRNETRLAPSLGLDRTLPASPKCYGREKASELFSGESRRENPYCEGSMWEGGDFLLEHKPQQGRYHVRSLFQCPEQCLHLVRAQQIVTEQTNEWSPQLVF